MTYLQRLLLECNLMIKEKYFIPFLATTIILFFLSSASIENQEGEWDEAEIFLQTYFSELINGDKTAIKNNLSKGFEFKNSVLESIFERRETYNLNQFDFRFALQKTVKDGVRVSPVILYSSDKNIKIPISVLLIRENGAWKIVSIVEAKLPEELLPVNLPEQMESVPVVISLFDADSGAPVYARVQITNNDDIYWAPRGHQRNVPVGFREGEGVGGDVVVAGKTYAYVKPVFLVDLPVGKYRVEAIKGMEYKPSVSFFEVTSGKKSNINIAIERWTDMTAKGWYSGDTHTHSLNDHHALLEMQAEDLNVVNVLATKWGELITNEEQVIGEPSPLSLENRIVSFNEEVRHGWLGHTILHPIKELIYPITWGGPSEGVNGGADYPPMAYHADAAHAQGGVVTWAHVGVNDGELAIDVALKKVDTLDVFTAGNAFTQPNISHIAGRKLPKLSPVDWWYKFLNTGFRLPATAGTDKMVNSQVTGSTRVYAHIAGGQFSYEHWLKAITRGKSFITTGPMISFLANEEEIGSVLKLDEGQTVTLKAEVYAPYDQYPIDVIEIVHNGKVIAVMNNDSKESVLRLNADIKISRSSWLAARVRGSKPLPQNPWPSIWGTGMPAMAHTNPIYVEVDGKRLWSKEDADFLIEQCDIALEWVRTEAHYHKEEQREEVIALFQKAKAVYLR